MFQYLEMIFAMLFYSVITGISKIKHRNSTSLLFIGLYHNFSNYLLSQCNIKKVQGSFVFLFTSRDFKIAFTQPVQVAINNVLYSTDKNIIKPAENTELSVTGVSCHICHNDRCMFFHCQYFPLM